VSLVIWHDLECGRYAADLPVWRELAQRTGGPVLELGCGAGRVALDLARHGVRVVAVDRDRDLVDALRRRRGELSIDALHADVETLRLDARFPLIIAPMQLVQMLPGHESRMSVFAAASAMLTPGGSLVVSLVEDIVEGSVGAGELAGHPSVEVDGAIYTSQPTHVRVTGTLVEIARDRRILDRGGYRARSLHRDVLCQLSRQELAGEAASAGLCMTAAYAIPGMGDAPAVALELRRASRPGADDQPLA
jgi:SAM-dependent methyltransferase